MAERNIEKERVVVSFVRAVMANKSEIQYARKK